MNKATNDALRLDWVEMISKVLADKGEDVLRVKSNEIAIPVVDKDGEDNWVVITVKVPAGSRDGDAYDGYGEAESYEMNCKAKAEKAEADYTHAHDGTAGEGDAEGLVHTAVDGALCGAHIGFRSGIHSEETCQDGAASADYKADCSAPVNE